MQTLLGLRTVRTAHTVRRVSKIVRPAHLDCADVFSLSANEEACMIDIASMVAKHRADKTCIKDTIKHSLYRARLFHRNGANYTSRLLRGTAIKHAQACITSCNKSCSTSNKSHTTHAQTRLLGVPFMIDQDLAQTPREPTYISELLRLGAIPIAHVTPPANAGNAGNAISIKDPYTWKMTQNILPAAASVAVGACTFAITSQKVTQQEILSSALQCGVYGHYGDCITHRYYGHDGDCVTHGHYGVFTRTAQDMMQTQNIAGFQANKSACIRVKITGPIPSVLRTNLSSLHHGGINSNKTIELVTHDQACDVQILPHTKDRDYGNNVDHGIYENSAYYGNNEDYGSYLAVPITLSYTKHTPIGIILGARNLHMALTFAHLLEQPNFYPFNATPLFSKLRYAGPALREKKL
jgi:hypothetical protein